MIHSNHYKVTIYDARFLKLYRDEAVQGSFAAKREVMVGQGRD